MTDRIKKYLITVLLLLACLTSGFLLIYTSTGPVKRITDLSEADSLLKNDFELYNISGQQLREATIRIDSVNRRKEYHIHVAPGFSKTQLHHEIKQTFYPYNIQAPGRVIFPQKDHVIHLSNEGTIFGSVYLRTDPDMVLQRNFASLMVAFESIPSRNLLQQVDQFGEPIPLVFMIEQPEQAEEIISELSRRSENIFFWIQKKQDNQSGGENNTYPRLQLLQEYAPGTGVLDFQNSTEELSPNTLQTLSESSLSFVDVSDAVLLREEMGRLAFLQELRKFSRRAQRGEHPTAILMAEQESLEWLQQELPRFKKSGLHIVAPKKLQFPK